MIEEYFCLLAVLYELNCNAIHSIGTILNSSTVWEAMKSKPSSSVYTVYNITLNILWLPYPLQSCLSCINKFSQATKM